MNRYLLAVVMSVVLALARPAAAQKNTVFSMVRSSGAVTAGCIPNASGRVTINSLGPVETMHLEARGLPPNTGFDFFVIQLPNAPFGVSWFQGHFTTDSRGTGGGDFLRRFGLDACI